MRTLLVILMLAFACGDDDDPIPEAENCTDGIDNDLDGLVDCDDGEDCACLFDASPDARDAGSDAEPPDAGDPDACTPLPERCNGIDDDCDGSLDEEGFGLCAGDLVCTDGTCSCPAERACGDGCVDIQTDPDHCGGCGIECAPGQGCVDGGCCALREETADVLFVIDNSGSMSQEQANLVSQMPFLLATLTSGDFEGDGRLEFPPITDLHIGVVTTDMGVGAADVPGSCSDSGARGDDGVLRTTSGGDVEACEGTFPSYLDFGGDLDALASSFACVGNVGTNGCGFEQQLEAGLKALTPSSSPIRFYGGDLGHGSEANAGFARDDSVLAIISLTDEADCSTPNADELFDMSSSVYPSPDLNLRCFNYPEALHPIRRYVDGFSALRPDGRLVFTTVSGVPADLVEGDSIDFDAILDDDRMQERVDLTMPQQLQSACADPELGVAFPARRQVALARDLEARGYTTSVGSICREDLRSVFEGLLRRLSSELVYECVAP